MILTKKIDAKLLKIDYSINETLKFYIGEFEIKNPKLWWPKELGDQPLYDLKISLNPQKGPALVKTSKIGIRKV